MRNRVTILDLATAAGVSVSTVDRILNKRGPVQRVTAEHVLDVARKINYPGVPSLRRRLSDEAPTRTLGFVLNRRERHLYGSFAKALVEETNASTKMRGQAIIRHVDDLSANSIVDALHSLAGECDIVAGVCIEHPRINQAVRELAENGVPFWALLSDISAPERAGFIGTNGWKLGRTAGWFMSRQPLRGGMLAVLIGSEQYLCQREYEGGFTNYLRETESGYEFLPTAQTLEDDLCAYKITKELLGQNLQLGGIFMAGGGIDGVVKALSEQPDRQVSVISTEISERTPKHLVDGILDVALSHEFATVARLAIEAMEPSTSGSFHSPAAQLVPMKIALRENL